MGRAHKMGRKDPWEEVTSVAGIWSSVAKCKIARAGKASSYFGQVGGPGDLVWCLLMRQTIGLVRLSLWVNTAGRTGLRQLRIAEYGKWSSPLQGMVVQVGQKGQGLDLPRMVERTSQG